MGKPEFYSRVLPEYREAIIPANHWMGVCHPYFVPNQPGPCNTIPPPPPPPGPPGPRGRELPDSDVDPGLPEPLSFGQKGPGSAPVPCGMTRGHDLPPAPLPPVPPPPPRPLAPPPPPPAPHCHVPVRPSSRPVSVTDPRDYGGYTQAPHPYIYWLAKRDVSVVAGENVDVQLDVDHGTGDKTYTVSSHASEDERRRIEELEREMERQLEEIRRIKGNMLTVDEDDTGVVFDRGME